MNVQPIDRCSVPVFSPGERLLSQSRTPRLPAVSDRMEEGRSGPPVSSSPTWRPSFPTSSETRSPGPRRDDAATRHAGAQVPGTSSAAPPGAGPGVGERRNNTNSPIRRGRANFDRPIADGRFRSARPGPALHYSVFNDPVLAIPAVEHETPFQHRARHATNSQTTDRGKTARHEVRLNLA